MAYFALLWKARTIEKYRRNFEAEKVKSIRISNTQIPKQSLSQRWRNYRYDTKKRLSKTFRKWYPEGSVLSNLFFYLKTDQTFPNFVLKSILGFVGGIIMTYLCFMFFVFQLSISLIHATIMSSIIGVMLTLGLAFSYRIRCLVFLLIPQFFSRVGRYSLTCYALVLILTGPATNTLKNSEVLSESLACGQEQIKSGVNQINSIRTKPLNSMKDSIKLMIDRLREVAVNVKQLTVKINRVVRNIAEVIQSGFLWLNSLSSACNKKLQPPYLKCISSLKKDVQKISTNLNEKPSIVKRAEEIGSKLEPNLICVLIDHLNGDIVPVIKKRLKIFSERITHLFSMEVHVHHSYSFSSNTSRTASQVAAGIVTEIRRRADPLLTWLSWSSCVTSLFLLLIIFRAKNYQYMFDTRSRFDNRYITKEIRDLDLKRLREGRETILPLNRRERTKFVTTTSFRLVASEKLYLNRSVVFMSITTFKLLIHMVADYSLYWVLMTIRYHGRFQSTIHPGPVNAGFQISGSGPTADMLKSILISLGVLLDFPASTPVPCLPNPYPPDLKRYSQIGILIFLLWFFAMFEPYGLRLRHVVMGHYQPDRAKSRAVWLYNHILRTRCGFMKFARRKLHRMNKYRSEENFTFQRWLDRVIPFSCLRFLLGTSPGEPHCLLCGTRHYNPNPDTKLTRCNTSNCPGMYCVSCFCDIGELCTICLSPKDYGDMSDVSLEKGSSDESDYDEDDSKKPENITNFSICETGNDDTFSNRTLESYEQEMCLRHTDDFDRKPLLPKTYQQGNSPDLDDNEIVLRIENPVKRAVLVRHKKNRANQRHRQEDKIEEVVNFCKYCNEGDCNNHDKINEHSGLKSDFTFISDFTLTSNMGSSIETNFNDNMAICLKYQTGNDKQNSKSKIIAEKSALKISKEYTSSDFVSSRKQKEKYKSIKHFLKIVTKFKDKNTSFSINLDGKLINMKKAVFSAKQTWKSKGNEMFPKCKKKLKHIIDKNEETKNETIIECRKKLPKKITVEPCNCNCGDDEDTNNDLKHDKKTENAKDKKKVENISTKTSESSRVLFKRMRTLFSDVWNNLHITTSILRPNVNSIKNKLTSSVDKKNHKRRKKKKCKDPKKPHTPVIVESKKISSDDSRNYRISAYLADQDWIKRQCKKSINRVGTAELSEALAIIKSRSKNLINKKYPDNNVLPPKLKKRTSEKIPNYGDNVKKNNITYSKLWRKIGYGFMSDSTSTSFIRNVFQTTDRILADDRRHMRNIVSPDGSTRLKFFESLGHDDFREIIKDNAVTSKDSIVTKKRVEGINIRKIPKNLNANWSEDSTIQNVTNAKTDEARSCSPGCEGLKKIVEPTKATNTRGDIPKIMKRESRRVKGSSVGSPAEIRKQESVKEKKSTMDLKGPAEEGSRVTTKERELEVISKITAKTTAEEETLIPNKVTEAKSEIISCECRKEEKTTGKGPEMVECCECPPDYIMEIKESAEAEVSNKVTETKPEFILCKCRKEDKMIMKERDKKTKRTASKSTMKEEMYPTCECSPESKTTLKEPDTNVKATGSKLSLKSLALEVKKSLSKLFVKGSEVLCECPPGMTVKDSKVLCECSPGMTVKDSIKWTCKCGPVNVITEKAPGQPLKFTSKIAIEEPVEDEKLPTKVVSKLSKKAPGAAMFKSKSNGAVGILKEASKELTPQYSRIKKSATKALEPKSTKDAVVMKPEDDVISPPKPVVEKTTKALGTKDPPARALKYKYPICDCNEAMKENWRFFEESRNEQSKGLAEEDEESYESTSTHCSCDGKCSDPETGEKRTCTCATQYMYSNDDSSSQMRLLRDFIMNPDENMEREIYDCSSTSCGENTILSSSINIDNETDTCNDPTICLAYVETEPRYRRPKRRNYNVVTKANRATVTDKPRLRDVSTVTEDWWSPIIEKRRELRFDKVVKEVDREITYDISVREIGRKMVYEGGKKFSLEKKEGGYFVGDHCAVPRKKGKVSKTDGKTVTFRSQAQIIPAGAEDILSPSRYLLESQRYYNELFSTKFYAPHLFPVDQVKKSNNRPKCRSAQIQTRRNPKTKRLEECYCYSPRKQVISPRRGSMGFEWTPATDTCEISVQKNKSSRSNIKPNSPRQRHPHRQTLDKVTHIVLNKHEHEKFNSNEDFSLEVRCNSAST